MSIATAVRSSTSAATRSPAGSTATTAGAALRAAGDPTDHGLGGNDFTPAGTEVVLAIKVAVAVGRPGASWSAIPTIQLIDVLAGRLIDELADAEHLAEKGDVVLARSALDSIGDHVIVSERRDDGRHAEAVGVVTGLRTDVDEVEPTSGSHALSEALVRPWILPAVYAAAGHGSRRVPGRAARLRTRCSCASVGSTTTTIRMPSRSSTTSSVACSSVLTDFGGNLLHVILGDKGAYLYAVFGTPHAHEDDASRAATAAIELLTLDRETAATDLQIGISHGRMRSGAVWASDAPYVHVPRRRRQPVGPADVAGSARSRIHQRRRARRVERAGRVSTRRRSHREGQGRAGASSQHRRAPARAHEAGDQISAADGRP